MVSKNITYGGKPQMDNDEIIETAMTDEDEDYCELSEEDLAILGEETDLNLE